MIWLQLGRRGTWLAGSWINPTKRWVVGGWRLGLATWKCNACVAPAVALLQLSRLRGLLAGAEALVAAPEKRLSAAGQAEQDSAEVRR